jgi:hypothetical protein
LAAEVLERPNLPAVADVRERDTVFVLAK